MRDHGKRPSFRSDRRSTVTNTDSVPSKATVSRDMIPGKIILVLQGGGALGAYQLGVYQALNESGLQPDWIIGTSIGAINAAIIAGNPVARRWERLQRCWDRMAIYGISELGPAARFWEGVTNLRTMTLGIRGFFEPNPAAGWAPLAQVGIERASYYLTQGLRQTLDELVEFETLTGSGTRLTVGAVNARTGAMRYFDSHNDKDPLVADHVLASGALPPAFPAIRIDGEPY